MGRDPASIASLKDYGRQPITEEELAGFVAELQGNSDRALCVLLGTAIEDTLRAYIHRRLRPGLEADEVKLLFTGDAPLATFSAKIRLGYAMGLYGPKTRDDLDLIRELRNACAHTKRPVSFDLAVFRTPLGRMHCIKDHTETVLEGGNTPRNRFSRACMMTDTRLLEFAVGRFAPDQVPARLP